MPSDNEVIYDGDFFKINRWILYASGLWEPKNLSKFGHFVYTVYKIYVLLYVYVWYVSSEFASILDNYQDLYETSSTLNIGLTHLIGAVKSVFFVMKGTEMIEIMQTLEDENFKYEGINDFSQDRIMTDYKKSGVFQTMGFYILGSFTVASALIPLSVDALMLYLSKEDVSNSTLYTKRPYNLKIPFEYNTPSSYMAMLVYQGIPHFTFVHTIIGMDCFLINVTNLIACHMVVLQGAFRTIRERCVKKLEKSSLGGGLHELNEEMINEFKVMIKHLQAVIECSQKLENLQRYIILSQMMTSSFVICSSLLLVSMAPFGSKDFNQFVVYMITMFFQLGIYCAFGNEITVQALEIPTSIWESEWLETTTPYKKLMMLTIHRMQKPIHLTIGKFAPLTLSTYMSIIKSSYSLFAVLQKADLKELDLV